MARHVVLYAPWLVDVAVGIPGRRKQKTVRIWGLFHLLVLKSEWKSLSFGKSCLGGKGEIRDCCILLVNKYCLITFYLSHLEVATK